jgi:alcohol dehydrogenase class IV
MRQNIIRHYGCSSELGTLVGELSAERVLVLLGSSSSATGAIASLIEDLSGRCKIEVIRSSSKLPELEEVSAALPKVRAFSPELIVAIGGGRILDLAKAINAFAGVEEAKLEAFLSGKENIPTVLCPMVAIPTTAGSGSESTHFAVVYRGAQKYSLASPLLLPEYAFLDGRLIASLPKFVRGSSAFDALSQAVESYWANSASPESRRNAAASLTRLRRILPGKIESRDPVHLQDSIEAANYSGQAINVSKTTAAHAYSYAFTYVNGIAHGQAVGYTLPRIFDLHDRAENAKIIHPMGPDGFRDIMRELKALLGIDQGGNPSEWFFSLLDNIGLSRDFSSIEFEKDYVAGSVNQERLANNPVVFSADDIDYIFGT